MQIGYNQEEFNTNVTYFRKSNIAIFSILYDWGVKDMIKFINANKDAKDIKYILRLATNK